MVGLLILKRQPLRILTSSNKALLADELALLVILIPFLDPFHCIVSDTESFHHDPKHRTAKSSSRPSDSVIILNFGALQQIYHTRRVWGSKLLKIGQCTCPDYGRSMGLKY